MCFNVEFDLECGEKEGIEFECQCDGELCCDGGVLTNRGDEDVEGGGVGSCGC